MLRFIRVLTRRNDPPTHGFFDEVYEDFRVGLTDIDLNLHLNNAKYLRYMDLVRLEHVVSTGLVYGLFRQKTNPIVTSTAISYLRELRTFQRFTVSARMVGYDERHLYYEQRFTSEGRVCTQAFVRLTCVHQGKGRPIAEMRDALGLPDSPELPEPVVKWRDMLAYKHAHARTTSPSTLASPR